MNPYSPSFGTSEVSEPHQCCLVHVTLLSALQPSCELLSCLTHCVSQGSCGYGAISKTAWPYWSVAAMSTSDPLYKASGQACGCAPSVSLPLSPA